MRIGIDARFLTHPQRGGFKTYTENLVTALATIDADNHYILYLDREPDQATRVPHSSNFSVRIVPNTLPLVGMPWREQVGLARRATYDNIDLLHAPSLTAPLYLPCPSVVTTHDMIWRDERTNGKGIRPLGKRYLMRAYYRNIPAFAARNAAAVLTVSHASKQQIIHQLHVPADQIVVTHIAASPCYQRKGAFEQIKAVRRKFNLPARFVLALGSADPRKNIPSLIHAYVSLPQSIREQYHLAIVWTHQLLASSIAEQITAQGIKQQVRFLEHVSDHDLALLYNAATLFVFPSRSEGFGLPPLEAMACGTPVVAANNSSIPEIVGDAAVLVDADDVRSIAAGILKVITNPNLQAELTEKGLQRAANFSWLRCARETLAVYEQVAATNHKPRQRLPEVPRLN